MDIKKIRIGSQTQSSLMQGLKSEWCEKDGMQEDQKETSDFLGLAFMISIGLIIMILVTQFNSVSKPIIIFGTVILSIMGVLYGFAFTGFEISIVMTYFQLCSEDYHWSQFPKPRSALLVPSSPWTP